MITLPSNPEILDAIRQSTNFSQFLRKIGLNDGGFTTIKVKILLTEKGIDFSHLIFKKGKFSKGKKYPEKTEQIITSWKAGTYKGWTGKTRKISPIIRDYLIKNSQERCSKCGWNERHPITNKVPLEINHKDGDAENCIESNLEVLCPNCHSLTINFRALNRQSKRIRNGAA